ncbi:MAG: formyl transferase [Methylocystaceae bacterium]|nr:formyl transferase [Methylocystaceae bacterium]
MIRALVIGSVAFSRHLLSTLIKTDVDLCGVICKPKSNFNTDFAPLGDLARNANIPYLQVMTLRDASAIEWIKAKKPDIIFCIGWSEILDSNILAIPPQGVIGYHPTLLPRNRGRHPIIWALALGLKKTGSTFFLMDEGADSGPILSQERILISEDMNAQSLYFEITQTAARQIRELIEQFNTNTISAQPQDHSQATYWRKRKASDGKIDWRMHSTSIRNLVRALSHPYPGADSDGPTGCFKIWDLEINKDSSPDIEPGHVLFVDKNQFKVKTGDGSVTVTKHNLKKLPKKHDTLL